MDRNSERDRNTVRYISVRDHIRDKVIQTERERKVEIKMVMNKDYRDRNLTEVAVEILIEIEVYKLYVLFSSQLLSITVAAV